MLGINTYRSYHAVLDAIQAQRRDVDLIVATGDLAQDHSQEAYRHFAAGIAQLPAPACGCRVTTIFNRRWSTRWPPLALRLQTGAAGR